MGGLRLQTLGELTVWRDDKAVTLPASKKTRALLAYLALTARPNRRDRLCEMFWEIPDDPRGALRWSLSKLRRVVNDEQRERLVADRERVLFQADDVEIDVQSASDQLQDQRLSVEALSKLATMLAEPFLDGIDLPNQELFQRWLVAEREVVSGVRGKVLERLVRHSNLAPEQRLHRCRDWLETEPFNARAGATLLAQLQSLGNTAEAATLSAELTKRFRNAQIDWPVKPVASSDASAREPQEKPTGRQLLDRQKTHFCSAADEVRIAYANVGDGPPLVKAANWLSHLELDWDAPIWSPLFRQLAEDHAFVRYDERGNGLSDWDVSDISFDVFVTDLETVIDAQGLERFPLLGISQGASVSIEYAVRHPERVSHLILFGAYAAGWRIDATPEVIREREAVMTLTETGWGRDDPAYRQIFSSTFMPSATAEELEWFNEFQRHTTSPENAARFLSAFGDIDVRHRLAQVNVPTLVIHSLGDRRIPVSMGRDIAATIPDAEFVGLESDGHLLLGREPASEVFVDAVRRFIVR